MRGGRHALRLRLRQGGVGGDDSDGGRLAHAFSRLRLVGRREALRLAQTTELAPDLPRGGPELRAVAHRDLTQRVDSNQRANRNPTAQHNRGRAQPPL
ncbi:hypothetical protein GALL_504910 [mine drainage metagenome]|uniref:Uncharacterized protein n=1 Tax=mine drainage metagenome TaxID=410659 RepID=A0A1J5P9H6_9ZZZZ